MARNAKQITKSIDKARSMAFAMGFRNVQESTVLALVNTGKKNAQWRDVPMPDADAANVLAAGTAIRLSITNADRTLFFYVD